MKTKLLCLALAMVFLLSGVLTACGKKTDEEAKENIIDNASENTRHLTMWVVVENALSDTTKTAVTKALNDITMSKFSTKLAIYFLTEQEYYQTLTDTIRANEDARNPLLSTTVEDTSAEETTEGAVETFTNEYGFPEKKYDPLRANQVDIVYIQGKDMYAEYVENGWLFGLDSELGAASKKIKEYISGTLLTAAKYNGVTYAIPNNSMIGEYTYMLLDKELMEECSMDGIYNQGKIDGFFNQYIFSYLKTVRAQYGDTIAPIDASYEEISRLLAHYWSFDTDSFDTEEASFSVLGYRYTNPKTLSMGQTVLSFDSLFADKVFCENFLQINEFRLDGGYYKDVADDERAAVKFCTGDLTDYEKLAENYYPVIVKYPTADVDSVFDDMFGVCSYSIDTARSMEIITYLNTNADFRNILQYGVEGVHYELEGEGAYKTVKVLDGSDYKMDIFKTGNAFIAYPAPGMDADVWEIGKKQNREALIDPMLLLDIGELGEAAAGDEEEAPTISSKGFEYTYKTGYAKETLMEDPLLNKWLTASDAAGSGVYVYHTSKTDGQNVTGKIYYYNNNISGAKVAVTDGNGAVSVDYTGTVGGGSEITVVSFWGKKNSSKLAWNATVNGGAAPTKVTYRNALLNFDFFETEKYDVVFSSGMTLAKLYNNTTLWSEIGMTMKQLKEDKTLVWTYQSTTGEGADAKTTYTYLFFDYNTNSHTVTAQPILKDGVLTLKIDYVDGAPLKADDPAKYGCFLVTATVGADVTDVVFDVKMNGAAPDAAKFEQNVLANDPEFVLRGELDTGLIKYFEMLNDDIEQMIYDCQTVDELKALIGDLNVLFTKQAYPFDLVAATIFEIPMKMKTQTMKDYTRDVLKHNMDIFYWNLHLATSKDAVKRQTLEDGKAEEDKNPNAYTGEAYYYYQTPYQLYYNWLKTNGFVTK